MGYKVILLSAGSIGATKDDEFDNPDSENILTHANACYRHKRAELIGIVDPDIRKATAAATKWSTKAYTSLSQIDDEADIVICATPTDRHLATLLEALQYRPKIVIAEKPFCTNIHEATIVHNEYKRAGVPIAVDYIRRYAPRINELKNQIEENIHGKIHNVKLTYTRGIFHEACHFIDLCRYLFGEFKYGGILDFGNDIKDNSPELTVSAFLLFEKCNRVFMCPADGRDYCVFDIDITTEKGRISLPESGTFIENYDLEPSKYGSYKQLSKNKTHSWLTGLYQSLYYLIDNAVGYLDGKEDLICTSDDAIAVHRIYDELLKENKNGHPC